MPSGPAGARAEDREGRGTGGRRAQDRRPRAAPARAPAAVERLDLAVGDAALGPDDDEHVARRRAGPPTPAARWRPRGARASAADSATRATSAARPTTEDVDGIRARRDCLVARATTAAHLARDLAAALAPPDDDGAFRLPRDDLVDAELGRGLDRPARRGRPSRGPGRGRAAAGARARRRRRAPGLAPMPGRRPSPPAGRGAPLRRRRSSARPDAGARRPPRGAPRRRRGAATTRRRPRRPRTARRGRAGGSPGAHVRVTSP